MNGASQRPQWPTGHRVLLQWIPSLLSQHILHSLSNKSHSLLIRNHITKLLAKPEQENKKISHHLLPVDAITPLEDTSMRSNCVTLSNASETIQEDYLSSSQDISLCKCWSLQSISQAWLHERWLSYVYLRRKRFSADPHMLKSKNMEGSQTVLHARMLPGLMLPSYDLLFHGKEVHDMDLHQKMMLKLHYQKDKKID